MKSKFILNKIGVQKVENAIWEALFSAVLNIVSDIKEITPRDLKRPPKNPNVSVTWSLERSIGWQKINKFQYKVWSKQGAKNDKTWEATNTYWEHLEYWTKYMKPRSFIRKWIYDNIDKTQKFFTKTLKKLLW